MHAASGLLVIPQFAVTVFAFDYLVNALGWSITSAGGLLAATQLAGAASRLLVGWWSDRVGSRLGPMRIVAAVVGLVMAALASLAWIGASVAVAALAVAAVVTVTSNGLAFTAVAERAGPRWAGRALGVQNTFQNVIAALVATPLALLIGAAGGGASGYALAFGAVVIFPFVAAAVIPVRSEALGESISASVSAIVARLAPDLDRQVERIRKHGVPEVRGPESPGDIGGSRVHRIDGVDDLVPAELVERPVDRRGRALDGIALSPRPWPAPSRPRYPAIRPASMGRAGRPNGRSPSR